VKIFSCEKETGQEAKLFPGYGSGLGIPEGKAKAHKRANLLKESKRVGKKAKGKGARGQKKIICLSTAMLILGMTSFLVFGDGFAAGETQVGDTVRASLTQTGQEANGRSLHPQLSADGRFLVFASEASNLVPGDTNGTRDIFRKDLITGELLCCSTSASGEIGNGESYWPSISADGRYVAFDSNSNNLVPNDNNGKRDIFRKDLATGEIVRCSTSKMGEEANGDSLNPAISADGRYVAFCSKASNLGNSRGRSAVFRKDLVTGQLTCCSKPPTGDADGDSFYPGISADGRYVAFWSDATNLATGCNNGKKNVFRTDLETGEIKCCPAACSQWDLGYFSFYPSLSADGRYAAFQSDSANLVPGDSNGKWDVFRVDFSSGQVARCSTSSSGSEGNGDSYGSLRGINADGRYVVFESDSTNLIPQDTNNSWDIFIKDMQTGQISPCSVSAQGEIGNGYSMWPTISADGRYVAFVSSSTNLVTGDNNRQDDIFRTKCPWGKPTAPNDYLFIQRASEKNRGTVTIPVNIFPEGKGAPIPIYVPPVVEGSNELRAEPGWNTIEVIEKQNISFSWEKFISGIETERTTNVEPSKIGWASAVSLVSGLLISAVNAIEVISCRITIQEATSNNLRAIIEIGDPRKNSFLRAYAGERVVMPPTDTFWLVRSEFSRYLADTFGLEKDNYPFSYYAMRLKVDRKHENDEYIGYISASPDNLIIITPKIYPEDEIEVIKCKEIIIPYKISSLLSFKGSEYVSLLEGKIPENYGVILSGVTAKNEFLIIKARSPIALRVADASGRITGVMNGETREEIPFSFYDEKREAIVIYAPADSTNIDAVGLEGGTYCLDIVFASGSQIAEFYSEHLNIEENAVHRYSVDWEQLENGEEGATVQVDIDGDGVFEHSVKTGKILKGKDLAALISGGNKWKIPIFVISALAGMVVLLVTLIVILRAKRRAQPDFPPF
jgi:Tol biopolymer transport system component